MPTNLQQPGGCHQFALKSVMWATAFVCAELAAIRSGGLLAIPLCVHIAVCSFLLSWTQGRTWAGAILGLLIGGIAAEFGGQSSLAISTIATLGSWFGIAIHGIWQGRFAGAVALVPACSWSVLVIAWAVKLAE